MSMCSGRGGRSWRTPAWASPAWRWARCWPRRIAALAAPAGAPKAKAVIWIFLCGGVSHVESFDPKPELNKYAGKSIDATPYKDVLNPAKLKDLVSANPQHGGRKILMGLNTGFRKYGAVRPGGRRLVAARRRRAPTTSRWSARSGRPTTTTAPSSSSTPAGTSAKGPIPTIGSWVCYGLGTLNQNLPEYVVLGEPTGDCCGGAWTHGAAYLGPEYAGVRLNVGGQGAAAVRHAGARA